MPATQWMLSKFPPHESWKRGSEASPCKLGNHKALPPFPPSSPGPAPSRPSQPCPSWALARQARLTDGSKAWCRRGSPPPLPATLWPDGCLGPSPFRPAHAGQCQVRPAQRASGGTASRCRAATSSPHRAVTAPPSRAAPRTACNARFLALPRPPRASWQGRCDTAHVLKVVAGRPGCTVWPRNLH